MSGQLGPVSSIRHQKKKEKKKAGPGAEAPCISSMWMERKPNLVTQVSRTTVFPVGLPLEPTPVILYSLFSTHR